MAHADSALLVSDGLFLDLDAAKGIELENQNRVKAWHNQIEGNGADVFVKRDEGRKVKGSGRPTFVASEVKLGGLPTLVFEEQELINLNEDAFDHMITGSGYTWFSVMCVYKQNKGKPDVNSFFGNLRNGPPYDGFWGCLMDDNRVWMGTRNGMPFKRGQLWDAKVNPQVVSPQPLAENRYYLIMGRMGEGQDVVDLELFVDDLVPVDRKRVPVKADANSSMMAIGQERDATNHPGKESFSGEIARFMIYNRALSDAELADVASSLKEKYLLSSD